MASADQKIHRVANSGIIALEVGIVDGLFDKLAKSIPGLKKYVGIKTIIVDSKNGAFIVGENVIERA